MKAIFFGKGLSILLFAWLLLAGCESNPSIDSYDRNAAITDIYVDISSLSLEVGASQNITFWPLPANADIMKLAWTSADPAVATVDRWGRVTAVKAGTTALTVSSGTVSKTVSMTVTNPPTVPLTASWSFDDPSNLAKADVIDGKQGTPMGLIGNIVPIDGPSATDKAIRIAAGGANYLKVFHGIPFPQGKDYVEDWSILIVFRLPDLNGWHTILQTDITPAGDADFFIRDNGLIGVGTLGYVGPQPIEAGKWYHLILSRKGSSKTFYSYVNGKTYHDNVQTDASRFNLLEAFLVSQDEDGEDQAIEIAEIAVWDQLLTESQAYAVELTLQSR
ncbi:MAG: Ig-like domain-containing protein [Tannerella sp.]|nr:Ig-like domain-containing protein [Tannerella sp.]